LEIESGPNPCYNHLAVRTLVVLFLLVLSSASALPRLQVSENQRYLQTEQGKPFFYLADTAWELFHRPTREEVLLYLKDRANKGFTVIQAVLVSEFDGLSDPNAYGAVPFKNSDPKEPNETYFGHVDWVVEQAEKLGLYMALLPTWGDKVGPDDGQESEIFNSGNASFYGEFLGRRYRSKPIIWILGGDRNPVKPAYLATWRAMAGGLQKTIGNRQLISFHTAVGYSSLDFFANDSWLDISMRQSGHRNDTLWKRIAWDYDHKPTRPVMDAEPLYEGHPIDFKPALNGYATDAHARKFAYWNVFSGAFGHTYGHHAVWQFFDGKRKGVNVPLDLWKDALDAPGAKQMRHLRALLESRPFTELMPDNSILASNPGAGVRQLQAARSRKRDFALVYLPLSERVKINMEAIAGNVRCWWYNPRSGEAEKIGDFVNDGIREFQPPNPAALPSGQGEPLDWVLVLDHREVGFGPPGKQ
jgi:hypothetical protein